MSSRVSVRLVRLFDLESILAIERASFGRDAYDRNLFAKYAHVCGDLFLVASKGGKVVGYAITCIRLNRAELISIAVHPKHRGCGAASALMDSTLRRLRRRSAARFALMVRVSNRAAIGFYRKYGFRQVRRVPRYYNDAVDAFLFVRLM